MAAVADATVITNLLGTDGAEEDLLLMRDLFGGGDQKATPSHHLFAQAPEHDPLRLPMVEESILNRLLSAAYSGPTLGDIENALSASLRRSDAAVKDQLGCSRPSFLSKGLGFGCSRMQDNKYTVRIKNSGAASGGMADDGYKWRKYGQKSIKNSPYPRSYYRCTNPRCNAKKQVERSADDPTEYVVTYEGLHLHYAYPQFFLPRLTAQTTTGTMTSQVPAPAQKRTKIVVQEPAARQPAPPPSHAVSKPQAPSSATHPDPEPASWSWRKRAEEDGSRPPLGTAASRRQRQQQQQLGLLEDIVPLLVRNPTSTPSTSTSVGSDHKNQLSSYPSSPLSPHLISSPSSSSCTSSALSWSPMPSAASTYLDVGRILSSAAP